MGKQLEGFLNVSAPVKKAAEQQIDASLAGLGIPVAQPRSSRSPGTWRQVEEKIDALEDKLDRGAPRGSTPGAAVQTERA